MTKDVLRILDKINKDESEKKVITAGGVTYFCASCLTDIKSFIGLKRKGKGSPTSLCSSATQSSCEDRSTQTIHVSEAESPSLEKLPPKMSAQNLPPAAETIQPLCKHYKRGRCRHGVTGKTMVNGSACKFLHPKKCLKYCRYGNDEHKGCQGSCAFFHPFLCRNSIRFKKCYDRECTFTHLAGTERERTQFSQYVPNTGPRFSSNLAKAVRSQPGFGGPYMDQRDFTHNNNQNFPPLPQKSQEVKIEEISTAIINMQLCLDKLMKHSFPENNPGVTNNIKSQGVQNNCQAWANPYQPSPNYCATQETKNGNNPLFLQRG
jgi:hypothetical protein